MLFIYLKKQGNGFPRQPPLFYVPNLPPFCPFCTLSPPPPLHPPQNPTPAHRVNQAINSFANSPPPFFFFPSNPAVFFKVPDNYGIGQYLNY